MLQGSLINGLESRVAQIEEKLSDQDARGSEEFDNAANERDLHRFILSGRLIMLFFFLLFRLTFNSYLSNDFCF